MTKLGELIEGEAERDAVHIAIAPAVASHELRPGDHVTIYSGGAFAVSTGLAGETVEPIGVVDPFLKAPVPKGARFYIFLYPNTITALRHEWQHPAFPPTGNEEAIARELDRRLAAANQVARRLGGSDQWMAAFADKYGMNLNGMIAAADAWVQCGEYYSQGCRLEGDVVPDEFWEHYDAITGRTTPPEQRESFFNCSG